jgi:hypothetical protein
MPQARKTRAKQEAATPVIIADEVAQAVVALAHSPQEAVYAPSAVLLDLGVDPTAGTLLTDASALLRRLQQNPWATHGALATWSATTWGDGGVDRLNAALSLLTSAGLVSRLGG